MKIIVTNMKKEKCEIEISEEAEISVLRKKLREEKNVPDTHSVQIICLGKKLEDGKTLKEYGVTETSLVIMVLSKKKESKTNPALQSTVASSQLSASSMASSQSSASSMASSQSITLPEILIPPSLLAPAVGQSQQSLFQQSTGQIQQTQGADAMAEQFRQTLESNPAMFRQLMLMNPQVRRMEEENPGSLDEMMSHPEFVNMIASEGQRMNEAGYETAIEVTPTEKQEIEELIEMGFQEEYAIQYYLAAGRNKELAYNILKSESEREDIEEIERFIGELSEEERKDIKELEEIGFAKHRVIEIYIACDKNKEAAADMLIQEKYGS